MSISKREEAARRSSQMEGRDHSNAASPKSQMSRGNILLVAWLILLALVMSVPVFAQISIVPENAKPPKKKNQMPYYEFLLNLESNLKEGGFTKPITFWEFFPQTGYGTKAAYIKGGDYAQIARNLVGIWINFQDKLVALRLDGDINKELTIIPIDKIYRVEPLIDSYSKTTITPGLFVDHVNSKERITGMQIRIVTADINSGTQDYFLNFYKSHLSNPYLLIFENKAQAIARCMQKIMDELEFMMNH